MKKSEANIEDLRNQTVSWGTHRPDDLIPKFMAVLKEYGKEAYDKYVSENPEVEDWKMLDDETKGWVVDELFDLLDGIAPEDCYFGAHPGDGADFGFWQVDESKKSEDTSVIHVNGETGDVDIYTINIVAINSDGSEDYLDDMATAKTYYDEDEAIKDAKELADSYKDDDRVVQVFVTAGEYEKPNGDIGGEPFDIFAASSSDKTTTAKYRKLADYENGGAYIDYYAKGDTSEAKKSEAVESSFIKDFRARMDTMDGELYDEKDILGWGWEWKSQNVGYPNGAKTYFEYFTMVDDGVPYTLVVKWNSFNDTIVGYDLWQEHPSESKKSEANDDNWVAYYFCKDPQGLEWAVLPHTANQIGNVNCLSERGGMDTIGMEYVLSKCTPVENLKDSKIYKAALNGEDRRIVPLKKADAERIFKSKNGLEELKAVVGGMADESKKSESKHGLIMATMNNGERKASVALESEIASVEKEYKAASHKFAEVLPVVYFDDYDAANTAAQNWVRKGVKPKSESKKSEKASVICSICGNPTDDPIWGEGNRAFCKDCYGDGADFKHGKTKFVVGMIISLDGVKQYIRELKPRTFVGQSVDTGKEFSLPISSLNRAFVLYDPRNESKKSESLTLKQKELKDMARYGEATDITTLSDAEAKELKKKGVETVGISRGVYGMNGALLRDSEGNKYVITARSSNLFYFV